VRHGARSARGGRSGGPARLPAVAALVATAAVATLATGCATGSTPTPVASGATCDTPGFAGKTIKIGFIYPDTGAVARSFGAAKAGFMARIAQQNASGGIHGRQIVWEWQDDQGDPGVNAQASAQLARDGVFGVVESSIATSGGEKAVLKPQDIPVTGLPAETIWSDHNYPNMFAHAYVYGTAGSTTVFGEFAKAQHVTRVAVIDSDVATASNGMDTELKDSLKAAGIAVSPQTFIYNSAHTNPEALGLQLKQAGVDGVVDALGAEDISQIMQGARAVGAPIKLFLAASGYDHSVLQQSGKTMAGLVTFLNYVPLEAQVPADTTYLNAMRRYVPELNPPDQELAFLSYISTDLFLAGLINGPACPTRASYIALMRSMTNYDAGGLLPGPVDMTKNWGRINNCYAFVRVNSAGTAYDVVPDPTGHQQWCGSPIP
jgi:ABC-type branched-subunit amino acid transport system substrate-binding protein